MSELKTKHCVPCEGGIAALSADELKQGLAKLNEWQFDEIKQRIFKAYRFKGFLGTMAFVNAVAWIAKTENHHPDMEVSYNCCVVNFQTHAAAGVTENDLICAAKVDALLDEQ